MSRLPEQFEVHVWEARDVAGGVASSMRVKDGSLLINDQVQGGAPSYRWVEGRFTQRKWCLCDPL